MILISALWAELRFYNIIILMFPVVQEAVPKAISIHPTIGNIYIQQT